jgi:hypothetical protein
MTEETKATSEPISDDKILETVTGILEPKAEKVEEPKAQPAELTAEKKEETESAEQESTSKQLAPEVQDSINKRIAKEVSKRKALEEELESHKAKISALENQVTQKKEDVEIPSDLSEMTPEQLADADREAREYMVWANSGPLRDGYESTDEKGETRYFSPEEIQETYNHFNKRVLLEIPQVQQTKQKLMQKLDAVCLANPILQDENSEAYKTFKKVWQSKEYASLRQSENGPEVCWLITKGMIQDNPWSKMPKGVPKDIPKTAPKIPVAPAPSRAKLLSSIKKANASLTEADYKAAEAGDLDAAIAKLIS